MTACEYKRLAEAKVAEWLEGVDEATFEAALQGLVEAKAVSGEYRFNRAEDRELAMQGARRFFADFARKIVPLSDGRCVYFVPDPRASERNAINALSWAEYAFHAVSAGGAKIPGTNYNERWFNPHKVRNIQYLAEALRAERCFVRLSKVDCRYDSVMFAGESHDGELVQVVTRLDEMGNMDANLSEVTFNAARRQEKKLPRFVPLTEAIQAVVHHQITAGSYPQDKNMLPFSVSNDKGADVKKTMTDISVIILTGKEEIHIRRCLEKLAPLEPRQVFIVESQKGDRTHEVAIEVAKGLGWTVVAGSSTRPKSQDNEKGVVGSIAAHEGPCALPTCSASTTCLNLVWHDWPGLYARQFNWALDNLPVTSTWVLRLDADEYLTPETIEKLRSRLKVEVDNGGFPPEVSGLNIELKRRFCGGEIRHATNGIRQARIFRYGVGRCEEREMDEHIELTRGEVVRFDGAFYDDNLNDMDWWRAKHRGYALREAKDALAFMRGEVRFIRSKEMYYRLPPYFRAFVYYVIRYFLRGGFLDGYPGWMWNFWQGLWYRCRVDYEIGKMQRGGLAQRPVADGSHAVVEAVGQTDLSVIILTGQEEMHIRRCLEKLAPLAPKQIFVVESQKGDRTHEIAIEVAKQLQWQVEGGGDNEKGVGGSIAAHEGPCALPTCSASTTCLNLVWHDWPGNQAAQFNWALDNLPIDGQWVLRLDADEYLTPETIEKLGARWKVGVEDGGFPPDVNGVVFELKRRFCGGEIRHGTNGIQQVRAFRRGKARYPDTLMDERIKVAGEKMLMGAFYDDNLNDMDWWRAKHRGYAKREARQAFGSMQSGVWVDSRKAKYYRLPRYLRAFAYFSVRYFVKGGILDGYAGWMWNFWQGLWYRCRVDYEIGKKAALRG